VSSFLFFLLSNRNKITKFFVYLRVIASRKYKPSVL